MQMSHFHSNSQETSYDLHIFMEICIKFLNFYQQRQTDLFLFREAGWKSLIFEHIPYFTVAGRTADRAALFIVT